MAEELALKHLPCGWGKQRRDNQSIDSLLRTDALLVFAQMSLLKLLSIMILCFIDFLDSSIPCISLIKKKIFFSEIQGIIFYSMVILDKKYTSYLLLNQHFLVSFN